MKIHYFIITMILIMLICLWGMVSVALAEIPQEQAIRAIIGEASNQGFFGMKCVACGIINRGTLQGVYGVNAKHIDSQPQWVWKQAQKAYNQAKTDKVHTGTHWGSTIIDKAWIKKMERNGFVLAYEYKDHKFYKKARKR